MDELPGQALHRISTFLGPDNSLLRLLSTELRLILRFLRLKVDQADPLTLGAGHVSVLNTPAAKAAADAATTQEHDDGWAVVRRTGKVFRNRDRLLHTEELEIVANDGENSKSGCISSSSSKSTNSGSGYLVVTHSSRPRPVSTGGGDGDEDRDAASGAADLICQACDLDTRYTGVFTCDACVRHRVFDNPECPGRVVAVLEELRSAFPSLHVRRVAYETDGTGRFELKRAKACCSRSGGGEGGGGGSGDHIRCSRGQQGMVVTHNQVVDNLLLFHSVDHVRRMFRLFQQASVVAEEDKDQRKKIAAATAAAEEERQVVPQQKTKSKKKREKKREEERRQALEVKIDDDTAVMEHTQSAAMGAVATACAAVDAVIAGQLRNAFCVIRPPGHHAEPEKAMGFCFFNNVGVAACYAVERLGLKKVAVIDFDVHHGNGTQAHFFSRPHLFYASTHQRKYFPHTGQENEVGIANQICNVPLHAGTKGARLLRAYAEAVLPRLRTFAPELVLLSAGFDAHEADPLAHLRMRTEDFYELSKKLLVAAAEIPACHGRVVSLLEGGYDLIALRKSVNAHVRALVEESNNVGTRVASSLTR